MASVKLEDDINNIPLADDDPQGRRIDFYDFRF